MYVHLSHLTLYLTFSRPERLTAGHRIYLFNERDVQSLATALAC